MDLTLPEIPGAIIGYRNDGRPIRLIAGASPDDPSNGGTDEPDEPETGDDPDDGTDWKAKYEELSSKYDGQRKVNKDLERKLRQAPRPTGRQPATGEADAEDDALSEAERSALMRELEAAVRSAAYTVGGDAPKLLDSLAFRKKLDALDVDDVDDFEEKAAELMRAELKKQPKPPAKKQGADMSGGTGGQQRARSLTEALANRLSGAK